jgi:hypothetical protein
LPCLGPWVNSEPDSADTRTRFCGAAYSILRETVPASAQGAYRNLRGQHGLVHRVIHRLAPPRAVTPRVGMHLYPFLRERWAIWLCAGLPTDAAVPISAPSAVVTWVAVRTQICETPCPGREDHGKAPLSRTKASTRFVSTPAKSSVPDSAKPQTLKVEPRRPAEVTYLYFQR